MVTDYIETCVIDRSLIQIEQFFECIKIFFGYPQDQGLIIRLIFAQLTVLFCYGPYYCLYHAEKDRSKFLIWHCLRFKAKRIIIRGAIYSYSSGHFYSLTRPQGLCYVYFRAKEAEIIHKGIPIVMLHGLLGGAENWNALIPYLPKDCNPLNVRLPFFEERVVLNDVESAADYVQDYVYSRGATRAVLMGNSLGGHIAALLAFKNPKYVRGLVLTASSGLFERGIGRIQGARPKQEWIYDKCCEVFYDNRHVTPKIIGSVTDIIFNRQKLRKLIQIAKSAKRSNIAKTLEQITCPTLLIWGKQDQLTPPDVAREFHARIPRSELVWLDECGHAPMMEHPETFGRAVTRWWEINNFNS
jgi:2-hydroxy-6-oxonona-2,4-dienedioate hydrolase